MRISKGSYTHKSFISLKEVDDETGSSANIIEKDRVSELGKFVNSWTLSSQVKLDTLAKDKKWEIIDTYGLEELRDGFFDAVYTVSEKLSETEAEGLFHKDSGSSSCFDFLFGCFRGTVDGIMENKMKIFKFTLAYFIAMCVCLIMPVNNWFGGEHTYFVVLAVVIHHPVRSVPIQFEISLQSIVGGLIGIAWAGFVSFISIINETGGRYRGVILFLGLFLSVFTLTWIRASFIRLTYFSLSSCIAIFFLLSSSKISSGEPLEWKFYWDFGISYLLGIVTSLVVCACVGPQYGQREVVDNFCFTIRSVRLLLEGFVDKASCNDTIALQLLQDNVIKALDMNLTEGYREFANRICITCLDLKIMKQLRNRLATAISPLRVIPLVPELLTNIELDRLYEQQERRKHSGGNIERTRSQKVDSSSNDDVDFSSQLFTSRDVDVGMLQSVFSKAVFELILELIKILGYLEITLESYVTRRTVDMSTTDLKQSLNSKLVKLDQKVLNLDIKYKDFIKKTRCSKDLLNDSQTVNIFVFLRYLRQFSNQFKWVVESAIELGSNLSWKFYFFHYPLSRVLSRQPRDCLLDQGSRAVLIYFQTKNLVDEAFKMIYNTYTSRHKDVITNAESKKAKRIIRAIDHRDFNFHTTENPLRYKLWIFTTMINGAESKWAFKVTVMMIFFCIPSYTAASHQWYQQNRCWWNGILFYILSNRMNSSTWGSLLRRLFYGLFGIILGWSAVQLRQYSNSYIVAIFAFILCVFSSIQSLVSHKTKSCLIALICYAVVALQPYNMPIQLSTSVIWSITWKLGISLLIGIFFSIPINWIIWPVFARSELRYSASSLLAHLSQSYQIVTERYLYRDSDDDSTETTIELANIREIRLSQSILAIKGLLESAKKEPGYISDFKPYLYEELIEHCKIMMQKIIEARMASQKFQVWEHDADTMITRALLSLRRDSVVSVIFIFYMLSNCFRSKNKIPKYLPNAIYSRKKLFDYISKFSEDSYPKDTTLAQTMTSKENISTRPDNAAHDSAVPNSFQIGWSEIYEVSFTRAFTDITEVLQRVVMLSREILGEET